ncbi:MAG TPA: glycerophosphodiester phosphodiesterase family protein [Pyrinomonadaceae bacterium]
MSKGRRRNSGLLIIGHRGSSAYAPENTHAAFAQAFDDGADGIEFDVRLARDGVPVVIHDATLDRTALMAGEVESQDSTALMECRVGQWFNQRRYNRTLSRFADERIPMLAQVYARYSSKADVLYAEMKCDDASRRAELARAVVEMTLDHGIADRVIIKSFALDSLREVKRLAPEIRTAALFGRSWPRPFVTASKILAEAEACGADEISLHHSLLRAATVEEARRRGFEVLTWTVNSRVWLRRALALKLRAVFTDRPSLLRAEFAHQIALASAARLERLLKG